MDTIDFVKPLVPPGCQNYVLYIYVYIYSADSKVYI